jgi:uncharacterized protein (TIRG00374 family)
VNGAQTRQGAEEAEQLFAKQFVRKLLFPVILAVLAYSALLLYGDLSSVLVALRHVPFALVVGASALSLFTLGLRALRWHRLLRVAKVRVPYRESLTTFAVGLGMSITPGKVGEILKPLLLKERCDIPMAVSTPVVVAERLTDLGALLALGVIGLLWRSSPALAGTIAVVGLVALFVLGRSRKLGALLVRVFSRLPVVMKYRAKIEIAHASLYELWSPASYLSSMALSLLAWGGQALIIVWLATALPDTHVRLADAFVAHSAPILAGTLSFLPGGVGLTEASMAGTLRALSGASPTAATTLTILVRGVTFWLAILIGLTTLVLLQRGSETRAAKS